MGVLLQGLLVPIDATTQSVKSISVMSSWNYSLVEGYGWTMTPVVNSTDDTTFRLISTKAVCLNLRNP